MSPIPSSFNFEATVPKLPPVITVTPASMLLTPPLTPITPTSILKCTKVSGDIWSKDPSSSSSPDSSSPSGARAIPHLPSPQSTEGAKHLAGGFVDHHHSLHFPLTRHLALLHPNTPKEIVHFIATRLLSKDRPFGHEGEWEPVWQGCGDLSNAGVGKDAGKGCKQREDGQGKEVDKKLEEMYGIARESFKALEIRSPGVDKL